MEIFFLASTPAPASPEALQTLAPVAKVPELEFFFSCFSFAQFLFFFRAFLEVPVFVEELFVFEILGLGHSTLDPSSISLEFGP